MDPLCASVGIDLLLEVSQTSRSTRIFENLDRSAYINETGVVQTGLLNSS
jgi:hypothetical protein